MEHKGRVVCPTCYSLAAGPSSGPGPEPAGGGGTGSAPRPKGGNSPIPRPGGGTGGIPRPGAIRPVGEGVAGGGLSGGPSPLMLPMLAGAFVIMVICNVVGTLPSGFGFCIFITYTMAAAISAGILHFAAVICGVANVAYPDAFKAAGLTYTTQGMLLMGHVALLAGGVAEGPRTMFALFAWVYGMAFAVSAVDFAYEVGWGKAIVVWLAWAIVSAVVAGIAVLAGVGAMIGVA